MTHVAWPSGFTLTRPQESEDGLSRCLTIDNDSQVRCTNDGVRSNPPLFAVGEDSPSLCSNNLLLDMVSADLLRGPSHLHPFVHSARACRAGQAIRGDPHYLEAKNFGTNWR